MTRPSITATDSTVKEDTYNNEGIECPACGYVMPDSWDIDGDHGEYDCDKCGKAIIYTRNVSVSYSATLKGESK